MLYFRNNKKTLENIREQTSDISNQTKKSQVKKIDFLGFGIAEKSSLFILP